MTQFEKDFILKCLDFFELIISSPGDLSTAIECYSGNNSSHPRYHSNSAIPDGEYWTERDKLNFSAAVFESTARATEYFLTQLELSTLVSLATACWQTSAVPLLTVNTDPNNRTNSIINNCSNLRAQIFNEEPSESLSDSDNPSSSTDNPYGFFSVLVAGAVVVGAIGATLALKK
jgi:hypothetical protein